MSWNQFSRKFWFACTWIFTKKFITFEYIALWKNYWYLKKRNENIILLHQKDFKPLWHDKLENSQNSKSIFNIGSTYRKMCYSSYSIENVFLFFAWSKISLNCSSKIKCRSLRGKPANFARLVPNFGYPGPLRPLARFLACPVFPLSRDKEETSVPMSRKVALSRPVGNPAAKARKVQW